jgi:alcohol dehydrogenase
MHSFDLLKRLFLVIYYVVIIQFALIIYFWSLVMKTSFSISRLPRIEFGAGKIAILTDICQQFGKNLLIVTGASSFTHTPAWAQLQLRLNEAHLQFTHISVAGEPTPQFIDTTVLQLRDTHFDVVVGIGGGSALDAAKAIAGLLASTHSVLDYLEGVGPELTYAGPSTPFIAIPTTAGTGSEATKNAVLSTHGALGYKKSFRDESLIPEYAIIDPDLLTSCPPALIAANGMDAFTQLLEAFVSNKANPFTDALAISGIETASLHLLNWYHHPSATDSATAMAYSALLSGICLAQVGLGSVHGLAAPLGAFFPIPHGVACGTILASATDTNIQALRLRLPTSNALRKYAQVGRILAQNNELSDTAAQDELINTLITWTSTMQIPRLGDYGVELTDCARIVANSRGNSMKTNPITLTDEEIGGIIKQRL